MTLLLRGKITGALGYCESKKQKQLQKQKQPQILRLRSPRRPPLRMTLLLERGRMTDLFEGGFEGLFCGGYGGFYFVFSVGGA